MCGFLTHAQVKIGDNVTNVGTSSSLELESANKALVITRVANTAAITNPVNGMIIYDISSNCIKAYENGVWTNCLSNGSNIEPSTNGTAVVSDYSCSTASTGTLTAGVQVSGVTQTITATVTQLGSYSISVFANGVIFAGSGTFTNVGPQPIVLSAIGTPVVGGSIPYTLNTTPNCFFNRTVNSNPSSGGSAVVSGYTCTTASAGTPVVGTAVSGVTQTITASVTIAGTYSITAVKNGITFAGSGTFSGTGSQNVLLTATGTPTTPGSNQFDLSTTPNCSFTRLVNSPTSGGTAVVSVYNCSGGTSTGTLTVGTAASNVTQTVSATVTTAGTYNITVAAVHGVSWSASGTFAAPGTYTVTLAASGTPTTAGTESYPLATSTTCTFTRSVGEAFAAAVCATTVGTFPATLTVGGSSVTVAKTGTSTDVATGTVCNVTFGSGQQTVGSQYATYAFSVPLKNVQVYSINMESNEGPEGYTVTASQSGVSVPVQLVPLAIGNCNSNFTATQSGAAASIRNTGSTSSSGIAFNISASGTYDTVTITRVGNAGGGNAHSLAFCNATAVPNSTSGGSAVVSNYNCAGATSGTMSVGNATTGFTKVITATVGTIGTYNITTNTINGVTFTGSGSFTGTSAQSITLTASGTPAAAGTFTYTVSGAGSPCSFTITVLPARQFLLAGGSNDTMTLTGATNIPLVAKAANGITLSGSSITLKAGKKYRLTASLRSGGGGWLSYAFVNSSNTLLSGTLTGFAPNTSFVQNCINADGIHTVGAADETISLRVLAIGTQPAYVYTQNDWGSTTVMIEELTNAATYAVASIPVEYTGITGTTDISWSNPNASNGASISGASITLKAGKRYRLTANLRAGGSGSVTYQFVNTANTLLAGTVIGFAGLPSVNQSSVAAEGIYKVGTADEVIKVRAIASGSTGIYANIDGYSSVIVEEIPDNATHALSTFGNNTNITSGSIINLASPAVANLVATSGTNVTLKANKTYLLISHPRVQTSAGGNTYITSYFVNASNTQITSGLSGFTPTSNSTVLQSQTYPIAIYKTGTADEVVRLRVVNATTVSTLSSLSDGAGNSWIEAIELN